MRAVVADITSWFDWDALSAIGTVGALWFAVVQSSRTGRLERARAIGTLTALNSLIEPICEAVPIFPGEPTRLLSTDELTYLIDSREIVERALSGLKLLTIPDVAAAGVSEWYMALPIALEEVLESLPKSRHDTLRLKDVSHTHGIRYISEASENFRENRDLIQHGRLGRLIMRRVRRFRYE
ncbi:hypothetical protein [Sphingobium fluviale]|uniref:Uncharacterized protein n=1 Tax=Sphingobium fluviale TaxID=2506423 RepID=A0A4Q1KH73_9SPHN|nr:hypothetical protein [Sphingobium fluviale]RXR27203.1 hypothetical protein EQG66_12040 [Sphingobium fluviale]